MARIVEAHGYRWFVPEAYKIYLAIGPHENELVEWWLGKGFIGGEFVDAGAHVGLYSIRLHKLFDMVHAFDPHPLNYATLRKNIEINHIRNIKAYNVALWDREAKLKLWQMHSIDTGTSVIADKVDKPYHRMYVVDAKPLDSFGLEDVRLIKIDVEGNAGAVLRGAAETIKRCKPIIQADIHGEREKNEIESILGRLGYRHAFTLKYRGVGRPVYVHESATCLP